MFCPNCGSSMNENATFCPNCGYKNTNRSNKNDTFAFLKHINIKYILIVVCIIFALFVFKTIATNVLSTATSITTVFSSEENKCRNDFIEAMDNLKSGNITELKQQIEGDSLGSIDKLLTVFKVDSNSVTDICKTLFKTYDYEIDEVIDNGNDSFTIKTKIIVPGPEYISELSKKILSKFDLTDLGVFFGASSSKVSKIVNKIIEGYNEVDVKAYGGNSVDFDVKMVKVDGKYKINNFSNFLNKSQLGKFIDNIEPILSSIDSFLN